MFVSGDDSRPVEVPGAEPVEAFETQRPTITLADVGGMEQVKERLEGAFLAPMRNPELRRLYGKNLRGGLLLYGPPGCGKTFLAKALAGELGAAFISAGLAEILDMWIGSSERNVHELFAQARQAAPCVLFLDEIDALGQKRTQTRNSSMRSVVNQLLTELDGIASDNEGVYVLAATNQPWDIDPALRQAGSPRSNRSGTSAGHQGQGVDLPVEPGPPAGRRRRSPTSLAGRSDGLSGADISYACELATERAMMSRDAVRSRPDDRHGRSARRVDAGPAVDHGVDGNSPNGRPVRSGRRDIRRTQGVSEEEQTLVNLVPAQVVGVSRANPPGITWRQSSP